MISAMTLRPADVRKIKLSRNPFKRRYQKRCLHDWAIWDLKSPNGVLLSSMERCDKCGAKRT